MAEEMRRWKNVCWKYCRYPYSIMMMVCTFGREEGGLSVGQGNIDRDSQSSTVVDTEIEIHRLYLLLVAIHSDPADTDLMD